MYGASTREKGNNAKNDMKNLENPFFQIKRGVEANETMQQNHTVTNTHASLPQASEDKKKKKTTEQF
jgi:hypothetical protein